MAHPSLSIILPCYNAASTIEVTLRSLLQQSFRDIEILVVDDRSQDETVEIVLRYAGRDDRIKLIRNATNVGIGDVRNIALTAATADIVGFIDADDWVTRTYFQNLMRVMANPALDFVRCGHTRVTGTDRALVEAPEHRRDRDLNPQDSILPANLPSMVDYPYSWAGLFRRSFLAARNITFQAGLYSAEDRELTWRIHSEGRLYRCVSEYGYLYRRESDETLTRTGDRRQLDIFKALERIIAYVHTPGTPTEWKVKAHRQALALIVFHYDQRTRLRPEVAAEFMVLAQECVRSMQPALLEEALDNFGAQRERVIRQIAAGSVAMMK